MQSNNAIEFTELHFVIITAINERSHVTLHMKRVSFAHLTGITSLVSRESFEIVSLNSTRSGLIHIPILKTQHIKIDHM